MKTDFSINVNVSIGVTPEVVALVTSILTKQPTATVEAPASEQSAAEAPGDAAPAPAAPKRGRKAKTQAAEAPAGDSAEAQAEAEEAAAPAGDSAEAQASEQSAAEAPAEGKALTVEDVREAMRRARVRIEGEDWETNTTGEGYTKYHRQLNATFKNIAALLGSDKPSTLSEENYASFIKQCDELIVGVDGTITTKCPY